MDLQQPWQGTSTGTQSRLDFVRNVYLWLMGGFAVAALGALSAPVIGNALISVAGRFWFWILFGAQFGTLMFASSVSRRKPLNRVAYAIFTYVSGVIAGIIAMAVAQGAGFKVQSLVASRRIRPIVALWTGNRSARWRLWR